MNKKQIISICKKTTSKKINRLTSAIQLSKNSEGLYPYPEADGSSKAPFGKTGISKGELRLAELIVNEQKTGGGGVWEEITYDANNRFDQYNNDTYIECIAQL